MLKFPKRLYTTSFAANKAHAEVIGKPNGEEAVRADKQMLAQSTLINTQLKEFSGKAYAEFENNAESMKLMQPVDKLTYGKELSLDYLAKFYIDQFRKDSCFFP